MSKHENRWNFLLQEQSDQPEIWIVPALQGYLWFRYNQRP